MLHSIEIRDTLAPMPTKSTMLDRWEFTVNRALELHETSLADLSEMAGRSHSVLATLMRRLKSEPEYAEMAASIAVVVAKAGGVSVDWLCTGEAATGEDPEVMASFALWLPARQLTRATEEIVSKATARKS